VLFAAPNAAGGKVTGNRKRRHTPEDYAGFLKLLGRKTAKGKVPHIIADNVPSRKAEPVKKYLKRKGSRFVGHFIPIYGLTPVCRVVLIVCPLTRAASNGLRPFDDRNG
jgi:transposase